MADIVPPSKKGRKFHHKSRYGCLPCKQRRIKCDEVKPICGNCVQRGIDCPLRYFGRPTSQRLSALRRPSNPSTPPLLGWIPTLISATGTNHSFCRRNTRDLELYCHFQVHTAGSFSHLPRIERLWREGLPQLAASFPFIGHGLLSLAYIHLASLSRTPSRTLLAESAFHVNQALPEYLEALKNITEENAGALFGFAMFVSLWTMANVSEECGALLQEARNLPYKRIEAVKGLAMNAARLAHAQKHIFSIFWRYQRWISNSLLYPAIQRYSAPMLGEPSTSWIRIEDGRLATLSRLWEENPGMPLTHSQALSAALGTLRETFSMVTQLTVPAPASHEHGRVESPGVDLTEIHQRLSSGRLDDVPSVFTWFIRLTPDFGRLMEQGNVYAMVVLAHYAILLDRACHDRWWIHELPHRLVAMAELALGPDRRGWVAWPLMVVGSNDTSNMSRQPGRSLLTGLS
ncbi:Zn(II)2Cys6 transcription factor domain-containing protein [Aspergillus mulundensis]|uniref:Zn(2)-C6 fungal-type domain-containing protein n=1 Tax=Aspergillus mulundensis TaxID=1810919 RepID=A0A3D8SB68_9EURO|nr:Uncharacterized protein DSM5745_03882 [Aspergillus mulundensis]RDW83556.1 Uncharacterized protein DSM5745_03882 [Aspergillus mulundensis]